MIDVRAIANKSVEKEQTRIGQECHWIVRAKRKRGRHFNTCAIAGIAEISGKGVWLVIALPLRAAAVIIVGEDLVIVNVTTGKE
jgi:hypothetical protein